MSSVAPFKALDLLVSILLRDAVPYAPSGAKPEQYAQTFQSAADIGLSADGKYLLVPDMKAGALYWMPK